MTDFEDLDALERDFGPSLRLALRERASVITEAHRPSTWSAGGNGAPPRDASLNLEHLEPPAHELTVLEAESTPNDRPASRRWIAAAAAVAAVVVLVIILVTDTDNSTRTDLPVGPGPAPTVATTGEESSTSSIPDGEVASGQVTSELVASIDWLHDIAWGTGVVYVYADGRVISIGTGGPNPNVWVERRLTTDGVALVQSELSSTGLFDPDGPDATNGTRGVVVRLDGRLVNATGSQVDELVARVRDLESWLPADAWVDREPANWEPERQAICLQLNNRSGRPRRLEDPASVIRTLPEPAATIIGDAQPWTPWMVGEGPHCYDVPTDAAREVTEALDLAVANGSMSGSGGFYNFEAGPPTSAPVAIGIWPLLPHGQPAFFGS